MRDISLRYFREMNVSRCNKGFKQKVEDWTTSEWAMATTGEVGELCNLLKKRLRGEKIEHKSIKDEFADIFTYLDLWAEREGIDLAEAVITKFNEVSQRVGSDITLGKSVELHMAKDKIIGALSSLKGKPRWVADLQNALNSQYPKTKEENK